MSTRDKLVRWSRVDESDDDIIRKIESLTRVINDKSATPGEKENAIKIRDQLRAKLSPEASAADALRSLGITVNDRGEFETGDPFFDAMLRGVEKEKEYAANPDLEREDAVRRIAKLKEIRKRVSTLSSLGNVEATRDLHNINRELEKLMSKWTPDEYEKLLARRRKASDRGYDKRNRAKREKETKNKELANSAGFIGKRKTYKLFKPALTEFTKILRSKKIKEKDRYTGKWIEDHRWKSVKPEFVLGAIAGQHYGVVQVIREVFNECSPETQLDLINAVKNLDTFSKVDGITEIQKNKILKAFGVT